MPNTDPTTTLRAVFTFYSDILTLNSEGDSVVSEETLQGLGTNILYTLLGSILRIASPPPEIPPDKGYTHSSSPLQANEDLEATAPHLSSELDETTNTNTVTTQLGVDVASTPASTATSVKAPSVQQTVLVTTTKNIENESDSSKKGERSVLIRYLPDPGYFVAGAVAGGISRTATAPLDRLKVYLLVKTTSTGNAVVDAAKKAQPVRAISSAGRPLFQAVTDLYKSGGVRGFFAGEYSL